MLDVLKRGGKTANNTADPGAEPTSGTPKILSNTAESVQRRTTGPGAHEFASRASTRAFLLLIVCAVLCGPTAVLLATRARPVQTVATSSQAAPIADPADSITAGSTAATLVRVWLSAGQQDLTTLAALTQVDVSQVNLPARRPTPPSWVQVSNVARLTPSGLWTVIILAGGGQAGTSSAWRVLVRQDSAGFSALSLPARVGTPAGAGELPDLNVTQIDPTGSLGVTVDGFTAALLTGSADAVARWTSPGAAFTSTGRVCRDTTLAGLLGPDDVPDDPADGTQAVVLATINCNLASAPTGSTQAVQAMQYPLVLTARSGRWEVSAYADDLPGATPAQTGPTASASSSATAAAAASGSNQPSGTSSSPGQPSPSATTPAATPTR